jgi:hypothetical protein
MACKKLAEAGIPYSTSMMTPCPWFKEAVEVFKHRDAQLNALLSEEFQKAIKENSIEPLK